MRNRTGGRPASLEEQRRTCCLKTWLKSEQLSRGSAICGVHQDDGEDERIEEEQICAKDQGIKLFEQRRQLR